MPSDRPIARLVAALTESWAMFASSRRGATAIEYSLIATLICMAVIGAIASTGNSVSSGWSGMAASIVGALGS